MMPYIFYVVLAYLLGSIPSGLLIGKWFYGTDLRTVGSKNIGATNAYRILGKKAAIAVFLGDLLKGYIAVWLAQPNPYLMTACAAAAVAGHMWSIYLKFKGGRGVATGFGVFLCLAPVAALLTFGTWLLIMAWKRIVSLASIIAAISLPIFTYLLDKPNVYVVFGLIGSGLVVLRHKDNIIRLWHGEEKQITSQKR